MREMSYTLDDLINAVRKRAAEQPDFVYQRRSYKNQESVCVYTDPDGEPSCLIGCGLADVGDKVPAWDVEKFYSIYKDRELAIIGSMTWLDYWGIDWSFASEDIKHKVRWLGYVQCNQDLGYTWGRAVEVADQYYPIN